MALFHSYIFRKHPTAVRSSLIVGATIVYALIFSLFYNTAGDGLTALVILPALISGWLLGGRLGLVAGFIIGLLNLGLYFVVTGAGLAEVLGRGSPSLIVATIGGGLSGWLSDQFYRLKRQADDLAQERDDLRAEIVQRRQTEIKLKRQEEILQQLSDHLPIMIAFYDSTGKVLFLSRELERTLGWSMAELSEIDMLAECYPDPAYRQQVIDFMIVANEEWRDFKTKTKDDRLVDTSWFNIRLSDGSNIGIGQDITVRKQTELALRQIQDRYELATEAASVGIWDWNIQTGEFYLDPRVKALLGYSDEEIPNDLEVWAEYIHPDDRQAVVTAAQAHLEGQTPEYYFEHRMLHKDGSDRWILVRGTAIRDDQGQAVRFLGTDTDITERKQAEVELRESEEKWRSLVENAPDFIFIVGPDLSIQFINRTVPGMSVEEVIGTTVDIYIAPDHRELVKKRLEQAFQTGEAGNYETVGPNPDGTMRWYSTRIGPIKNQGRVTALILVSTDITEQKRVEETLAYARDQALETSRLKSELLAKVSHELRTPLNAILGFVELLDFGLYGPLTNNQQNAVSQVMESTNYLTKLVNELLDQAQLDAGHIKLNLTTFKTNLLLEEVQTTMSVLAESKGLQLRTRIAETMPDVLCSDRQNIQKILFNLIGNAIKFTEQGEIQVNLYCADAKQWTIEVRDTGVGIPDHALTKIFEPFQQVDGSLTRKHSGSGLGLSIVKQLTELMGGSIRVESEFGQGSIFTVLLPMHQTMETHNV